MEDTFSGLGNGTKFDNKVLQTSHSTVGHLSTKLRLVRCHKCRQVLPESANVPVYNCGGCNKVLLAKKHKNDQDKCSLKHNNGGDPNEYAQSNRKYIGGVNLLDEVGIVLKQLACQRYISDGRFFYSPNIKRPQPLGNGLQFWRGFYQSVKPTQMGLSLNFDMSAAAFIEPLPVIEFVAQVLGKDVYSRPLSDADCVKVKKALRGVKVEVTHRGNMRRKYCISGLTSQPTRELIFPVDEDKNMKSVIDYFQEVYGFTIRHSHLPCLLVGSARKVNYLPMEACKIVEGQRYSKRLNDKQITSLLKLSCQRPKEQEAEILQSAIGLPDGGHILCLSETKIVRKTLNRKCRSMSVLSLEDHIQHVDRRWEDAAKSHGTKRICRQLVIHLLSTAQHIRKQPGIHRWPFQRSAIGFPDGGYILSLSEKKIVRKTLKRQCRSMRALSLLDCQQHVDRRWEDAAKYIGAKHSCRQLKIPRVSIAKLICRQHGIHHRWPFQLDWATMKGYSLGDERPVEVISLSTHAKLVSRLQRIYISWLGRFLPRPSALPGREIVGPIALSSSEFAATKNIAQGVRQSGSAASDSGNQRTREQEDPEEIYTSITSDDLQRLKGRMNREDAAASLGVSVSTFKRKCRDYGIDRWPHVRNKKVGRPPDQHGEGNTSTARETPSHNVQTGMEGEPVGQNQEANERRQDFMGRQIALNAESGLIMVSRLPDQHGERSTSTARETPSHNVQTGIEGVPVGQNQEANEFRPDFTEGSIPSNTENGLIIGSSFGWASQGNDQSTLSTPYPNHDALGFPPPQITSMPSENREASIDLRNSLASQVVSDGHITGSTNLTFATCSDQAAPSQHVQGQSMHPTVYPDHNVFPQTQIVFSSQEPFSEGHVFGFSNGNEHTNFVMIKAFYRDGDNTIFKFLFPLTSGIVDLKKEVSKRLNVEVDRFVVKYKDKYEDSISILCDEDLMLYLSSSQGNDEIRVLVLDKVGGTPNFCEKCRSSMQTRA